MEPFCYNATAVRMSV